MTVTPAVEADAGSSVGERLRDGLRALTTRGRAFVAGGTTAVVCGLVLGERDLVRVGALIALLPLATVVFLLRSGHRLALTRTVAPKQIEVEQVATVQLDLTNLGARTGLLMIEEQVPWALGQRSRFVVDPMQTGWHRRVEYPVRAEVRGVYEVGPLRLRLTDPFGMLDVQRSFVQTSTLVVYPAAEPLPVIPLRGTWSGSGDNRPRPFSTGSTADVTVREYRMGDDLRRVHWRSTARTGELMVRREEQPWQTRCTIFLDNRAAVHRGSGPDSSLERAITVTASVAVHLARAGYQIRLVSADGEEVDHTWHEGDVSTQTRPVLEALAGLPVASRTDLSTDWGGSDALGTGMLVGVFGDLGERDRAVLSRLRAHGSASYALVLDVGTWAARGAGRAAPGTDWLQQRGWKASTLTRTGSLPAAWQELGR